MKFRILAAVLILGSLSTACAARQRGYVAYGGYGGGAYGGGGYYAAPPPPPMAYQRLPNPGRGYTWIDGYWYLNGPRYSWRNGYWSRPPFRGGYWVPPRYNRQRWYPGYWGR